MPPLHAGPPSPGATSNLVIVLDLLRQMLLHCTLPADTFASERLVVLSEMVLRGTLDYTLSTQEQARLGSRSGHVSFRPCCVVRPVVVHWDQPFAIQSIYHTSSTARIGLSISILSVKNWAEHFNAFCLDVKHTQPYLTVLVSSSQLAYGSCVSPPAALPQYYFE